MRATTPRSYRHETKTYDVLVVGGGMAGIAAAVTSARLGAATALVQDRPVLGGNASTEIRVNLEGANGGLHNRFFVESGLAEDLLLENLWRNPTGSADHWGALLLDLVLSTQHLDLHLDTHAHQVTLAPDGSVRTVQALTLASERGLTFEAPIVVDATGDGTIAYLAAADFLSGEDSRQDFDEPLAPRHPTEHKLGGTMQFMCKDAGRPVVFEPPGFARRVTADELRVNRPVNIWTQEPVLGGFWWIEYGGHLDTVADNPDIKLELLAEVFGVWDYVKNSAEWQERNMNLDLEWVAAMPGKRESRRIVGDHILTEHDLVSGERFDDAVAFGGWSIDNHAPRGFYDIDRKPCTQVQPPGVYQIPLRSLYARDVPNLLLAGRDISASHVACCSSRVMLTCTSCGEAVGAAAAICAQSGLRPRELAAEPTVLHRALERAGHHIPYRPLREGRPAPGTRAIASSEALLELLDVTDGLPLTRPRMLSLPLSAGHLASVDLFVQAERPARLRWKLFAAHERGFWIPDHVLAEGSVELEAGDNWRELPLAIDLEQGYFHLALAGEDHSLQLGGSRERLLGPLSWRSHVGDLDTVAVDRREEGWDLPQESEGEWGDSVAFPFSYWRRDGHGWGGPPAPGIAFRLHPAQVHAPATAVLEPWERPTPTGVHAWVGAPQRGSASAGRFEFSEPQSLTLELPSPIEVASIDVFLNSDLDHHLANIWYSHPPGTRAVSTLISDLDIAVRMGEAPWQIAAEIRGNHMRRCHAEVRQSIDAVRLTAFATHGTRTPSIMDVRLWEP